MIIERLNVMIRYSHHTIRFHDHTGDRCHDHSLRRSHVPDIKSLHNVRQKTGLMNPLPYNPLPFTMAWNFPVLRRFASAPPSPGTNPELIRNLSSTHEGD